MQRSEGNDNELIFVIEVCSNCKEPVEPDEQMLFHREDLKLTKDQFKDGKLMVGKGCDECFHSGYSGRTAIYEVMPIDSAVQEQIVRKATASEIKRSALERGLRTLRMDGVDKLLAGMTTPDEVLRAIADTGVDRISIGKLTKDVHAIDFSMRFVN